MVAAVFAVRYVLCLAVVVEVAALAECGQVRGFVVVAVAVEVGDSEDDLHAAKSRSKRFCGECIIVGRHLLFNSADINGLECCWSGMTNDINAVRNTAPFAFIACPLAGGEADVFPVGVVIFFSHWHGCQYLKPVK